jgi:hypothetical protein
LISLGLNINKVRKRGTPGISTLGLTTIGANSQFPFNGIASKFIPNTSGNITKLTAYITTSGYLNGATLAVFSDNAGSPDVLRVSSEDLVGVLSSGWYDFTALVEEIAGGLEISNGVPIWLAFRTSNAGDDRTMSDTGGASNSFCELGSLGAYPAWASPPSVAAYGTNIISIYATIN